MPGHATPFNTDGAVDYDSLSHEVEALAAAGNHAGVLFGVVSEFFKLADVRRSVARVVCDTAQRCDFPVVLSVTHEATEIAVKWAKEYEALGAEYLMIFPLSFMISEAEGVYRRCRARTPKLDFGGEARQKTTHAHYG